MFSYQVQNKISKGVILTVTILVQLKPLIERLVQLAVCARQSTLHVA